MPDATPRRQAARIRPAAPARSPPAPSVAALLGLGGVMAVQAADTAAADRDRRRQHAGQHDTDSDRTTAIDSSSPRAAGRRRRQRPRARTEHASSSANAELNVVEQLDGRHGHVQPCKLTRRSQSWAPPRTSRSSVALACAARRRTRSAQRPRAPLEPVHPDE